MIDPGDALDLPPLHYCTIAIGGEPLRALVDSGSTRTILGAAGVKIVQKLNLPIRKRITRIRTADGQIARAGEEVEIVFSLKGREREISACLLPSLTVSCLIGMDFLRKFGMVVD